MISVTIGDINSNTTIAGKRPVATLRQKIDATEVDVQENFSFEVTIEQCTVQQRTTRSGRGKNLKISKSTSSKLKLSEH